MSDKSFGNVQKCGNKQIYRKQQQHAL